MYEVTLTFKMRAEIAAFNKRYSKVLEQENKRRK
jgi:hypothetical protein